MIRYLLATTLVTLPGAAHSQATNDALRHSVEQLRVTVGTWEAVTEFLYEDGSVARTVSGTYQFTWVVPDRVIAGKSEIPELRQTAGILFYINEVRGTIEMVSVGADGQLWIMAGPLGGEVRWSQEYQTAEGVTSQLRFTRFNASSDSFESRMDYTEDGGLSWKPGNHQTFRRVSAPSSAPAGLFLGDSD
jgi:hypothetical protein